jgi:hypothetical protein
MYSFNVTWDEIKEIPQEKGEPLILNTPLKPTDVIWIVSIRDMQEQEELLLDYGEEYTLPRPANWRTLIRALPAALPWRIEERRVVILGPNYRAIPDVPLSDGMSGAPSVEMRNSADQSHLLAPSARVLGKDYRSDRKNAVEPTHPPRLPHDIPLSRYPRWVCPCVYPPQYMGSYVNAEIFYPHSGTPYLISAMIHLEYRASFRMVPPIINARREVAQPAGGCINYTVPRLLVRSQWENVTNVGSWAPDIPQRECLIHMLWYETEV